MVKELVICAAFLMLLTVPITSSEIKTNNLCETQSKTWTGDCNSSYMCDRRCRKWEGEQHGVCHLYEAKNICFCYSHCSKKQPSPPKTMAAPKKLCETQSKTWFGDCKDSNKCDKQCRQWENEDHGACHLHEAKHLCFCYSDCNSKGKKPSPPQNPPSPKKPSAPQKPHPPQNPSLPPGVGKPPPSGSGQPTPPKGTQPPPQDGGGGQPTPPGGGESSPPAGGGEPSPPDGSQPAPPDGGIPTPPPGCQTVDVDRLIAQALNNYKARLIDKAPHLEHLIKSVHLPELQPLSDSDLIEMLHT